MPSTAVRRIATVLALVSGLTASILMQTSVDAAGTIPTEYINDTTARPLGAITVIGDSVMLGSLHYSPDLVDALADRGWGPIRARGGMGYSTGYLRTADWSRSSLWIEKWRAEGWDAPNVVVNLGVNDAGLCAGSAECAVGAIDHLLDAIGPDHKVWWANITRSAAAGRDHQAIWNAALDEVAARRPELHVWDWAAVYATGAFPSGDRIHLSPDGYRARNQLIADDVTARLVTMTHDGSSIALPSTDAAPLGFTPIPPRRILDTRQMGERLEAGSSAVGNLDDVVPDTARAVAVNVTSTGTSAPGFLTAYACGTSIPNVSTVNHAGGTDRGAFSIVPIDQGGDLCVMTYSAGHVIVDLAGWFSNDSELRFDPLPSPSRLIDTRHTGKAAPGEPLRVSVPSGADAVAVNVTATGATASGFLTAHPCGSSLPNVSNVNFGIDEPVAGAAYLTTGGAGAICVTASSDVDVIVDLTGTFSVDGTTGFVPAGPRRLLDTRSNIGGWTPRHTAGATIELTAAPSNAVAVTGTLTLVEPQATGYLTAEPCGTTSDTSSVNARRNEVMANAITVGTTKGHLCITTYASTHTLFDVTGWWTS